MVLEQGQGDSLGGFPGVQGRRACPLAMQWYDGGKWMDLNLGSAPVRDAEGMVADPYGADVARGGGAYD